MSSSNLTRGGPTIFELVERTRKFIKFEFVHAGVAVAVFFGIFLVLQPWNYSRGSVKEDRPYWMVGPPLIYFMIDLLLALMLHFGLRNELRPKTCKLWMLLQVGNLIQLTLLGFFMIWEIEFVDNSYLKLIAALLVLYFYKAYRISVMQKLVLDMNVRCSITCIGGPTTNTNTTSTTTTISNNNNEGSNISSSKSHCFQQQHHHDGGISSEHILRPTFTISVQQPEAALELTTTVGNVKQESSA